MTLPGSRGAMDRERLVNTEIKRGTGMSSGCRHPTTYFLHMSAARDAFTLATSKVPLPP